MEQQQDQNEVRSSVSSKAANDNDVLMMQRRSISDLHWSSVCLSNFRIVPASVYLGWGYGD
jgi:hypothetical protein